MNIVKWAAAALSAFAISASAQSPTQLQPQKANSAVLSSAPTATTSAIGTTAHDLTKADVDAWLDGFMPYALKAADIPGAVVVVVKDGQPLTERGFGYSDVAAQKPVDPQLTLFRPGSVSKLFTWTSVMQLVQAGKLNLDTDVNQYLDFKIPPQIWKADHSSKPDDSYRRVSGDRQISDRIRQEAGALALRFVALDPGSNLRSRNDARLFKLRRVACGLYRSAGLGRAV